ncbi:MAG: Ig-like domain-containing protein [Methylococcaceae bacterium]
MNNKMLNVASKTPVPLMSYWRGLAFTVLFMLTFFLMSAPLFAAELIIGEGVVVKFGANAQLVVRDHIVAGKGIIFTSKKDDSVNGQLGLTANTPQPGDWLGSRLEKSAASFGALTLSDLTLRYAGATVGSVASAAMTLRGWSPKLQNLLLSDNGVGLRLLDSANPTITGSSFLRNNTGIEINSNSQPSIVNSQLAGNTVLAIDNKTPSTVIVATGNWWGHPSGPKDPINNPGGQGDAISIGIDFGGFVTAMPLLNPSLRLAAPMPYFDQHSVLLDLSCVNATEYRLTEGDVFANITPLPLSNNRAQVSFTTSAGDGRKTINVEFRDNDGTVATATLNGGVLIDTQAPLIAITNPVNGSHIVQPATVTATATATDESGVAKVEFFIDGQLNKTLSAAPYSFVWNTTTSAEGTHIIKTVATDIAGRTTEQTVTVTLSKAAPIVDTQGPLLANIRANGDLLADGSSLLRSSPITLSASDASGVARVELLLDSNVVTTASGNGSYTAILNLDKVLNGPHSISVRATDSLGNVSTATYAINVAHAAPATPILSQPANGSSSRVATITVAGSAEPGSDVQVFVNAQSAGPHVATGLDGNFTTSITLANGSNQIQATATDQYGTGAASTAILVTLDATIPSSPGSLTATAQAAGKVRLLWTRSSDPNAVGYDLYRASAVFDSIDTATKLNASPLTTIGFDDLPSQDGLWAYRVVSINNAGTPSIPSNLAQAVSDSTAPHALSVAYAPQGKVDPVTGVIGQGQIDVLLTVSEELPSAPFLSIVPQGGTPIPVTLTQSGNTTYTGSIMISAKTPSGIANALFSGRDAVGNRGTDIDAGATLKIDTAGPSLSGIALNPVSPINNDTPQTVEATLTFTKAPKTTPQVNTLLSGVGRTSIPLTSLAPALLNSTTWTGSFTLPKDAGLSNPETLIFSFQAIDELDNVSTKVLASNHFQVYQGNLPPLDVPFALTAKAQPGGKVKLAWQAVDQANSYQLYRQAPGQTELQPLTRATGTDYLDQTSQDGSYQYTVASVRKANAQEAVSGQSPPVSVVASATAPGAPHNLVLRLSGQGIVAEWQAPLQGKVANYNLYRADGTSITSLVGLTPLKKDIKQITTIDATPSPSQGAYVVTAVDAAGNESSLSNSTYLNASLLPVSQLRINRIGNGLPMLSWVAPNGNVTAYKVYADAASNLPKIPLTPNPISLLNFTDTGYNGGDKVYTVASVDANGAEMPRSLLMPEVTATIISGLPIQRGIMNQLQVQVINHSANALNNVRVVVRLPADKLSTQFKEHRSQIVNVDAKQTRLLPVVVGGYAELPDSALAQVRVEIAPNEGELVALANDQAVDVTEGGLVVGMSTHDFTRGATGKLKLTIENTTETDVELLTVTQNGQGDSTELRFKILDAEGNVLATQPYKQALGANVVALPNGLTVARIPAGSSYTSDEFSVNVPATSLMTLRVKLEVDKIRYHSGQDDEVVIAGRGSEKTVSLIDTAYFGDITDITPSTSFGDQDIVITGRAVDRTANTPLPNTRLKLVFNQQGFERIFTVLTDATGNYAYTFKPEFTDSGLYKVSAVHPDVTDRPEQKTFTINRVTVGPSPIKLDLPKNLPFTLPFTAKAGPGSSATNLKLTLDAASQPTGQLPAGINVQLPEPVSLTGKQSRDLPVVFTATNDAQLSGSLIMNVLDDEHNNTPMGQVKVDYSLTEAKPFLTSTPSFIETGMAQGGNQIESITMQNKGLQEAQNLTFKLVSADGSPAPGWVSIASQANGTLAVGDSRSIDLSFTPSTSIAEGVYEFKLLVTGDNVPQQTLNVFASVTQSGQGNVLFKTSDIYTATVNKTGQLIQGLAGATITVQNEDVLTITQELVTDSLGEVLFQNLPAGRYQYRAKASNHQEIGGRLLVKPGITFNQPVFLQYNLITVEWSVKEISLQDRYEITLNATFETDVPAPVVVIQPASTNLPKMGIGDVFYGELTLTNYGLVRADHVLQQLPKSDGLFRYEFLVDVPSSLLAKQRLTIPYRVVALASLETSASSATATGGGCYSYSGITTVIYDYVCANGDKSSAAASSSWFSGSNSSCGSGSGSGTPYYNVIRYLSGSGNGGGWGLLGSGSFNYGGNGLRLKGKKCVFIPRGNNNGNGGDSGGNGGDTNKSNNGDKQSCPSN